MYRAFPNLKQTPHAVTSAATPTYNCIAWAAGDTQRVWWPENYVYWPRGAQRDLTIDAFEAAYQTLGYERCSDGQLESGHEKIAIYARNGEPTHAARQLEDGSWTSKLGQSVDISHAATSAVEGSVYGSVVRYMRRVRSK